MTVEHRTYRVNTIGTTDAAAIAKALARYEGCKVRTVSSIRLVTPTPDAHRVRAEWDVTLAVVVP